jgi:cobalamin biosynthesis protein CbiG
LKLKTRDIYLGIGFHTDVGAVEIERAIRKFLVELEIEQKEVKALCTVDFKNTDSLREVSAKFGIPLFFFSRDEINSVNVQSKSAAMDTFNLKGVAEPCAILGATRNNTKCKFVKRKSFDRKITLAVVF